jgi:hypothetical protein
MNLNPIASNMTEVQMSGGLTVLFSYKTPVACRWTNGMEQVVYKTSKKWSATTSRHIGKWIILQDDWTPRTISEKPQEYFDNLLSEVK